MKQLLDKIRHLTKEDKKNIYASLAAVGFLGVFFVFIYAPQSRRFTEIKNKLKSAESQIVQITRITGGKELAQAVKDLDGQLRAISGKLLPLPDDQEIVNVLSREAKKLKAEIKNIILTEEYPSGIKVPGYQIIELPVSMVLVCEYKALGNYLNVLRDNSHIFLRVKQLTIKGRAVDNPYLDVDLQLSAYLTQK